MSPVAEMQDPNVAASVVLHNQAEFIELFSQGWTYPNRPLVMNKKYPYKLISVANPSSFWVQLDDKIANNIQKGVDEACFKIRGLIKANGFLPVVVESVKQYEQLPVAYMDEGNNVQRAEINSVKLDEGKVNITLVDKGEDKWVPNTQIFPPSTDLLRFPKLAACCRLANVVPFGQGGLAAAGNATKWSDYDYKKIFQGTETSTFSAVSHHCGVMEVMLECDGRDLALRMVMNLGLADFVPLESDYEDFNGAHIGKFPLPNYAPWIGQMIPVYGIKVIPYTNNKLEVVLQLDTTTANAVWEAIQEYMKSDLLGQKQDFKKEVGEPCLVRSKDGEVFRATITGANAKLNEYVVKFVDYWDFDIVKEEQLIKIPEELVKIPEGSCSCILAEMVDVPCSKEMKLKLEELVVDQNLFCHIGTADFEDESEAKRTRKPVVTLSVSIGEDCDHISFCKQLNLPEVELINMFLHDSPTMGKNVAARLFTGLSDFYPTRKYTGVLSCIENEKSVWLQIEGDDLRIDDLTAELTDYYRTCEENGEVMELTLAAAVEGTYVAAQQDGDDNWYRARITVAKPESDTYQVLFIDYGNLDCVKLANMKRLTTYFGKDKCFAMQVALPIQLYPEANLDKMCTIAQGFCEEHDFEVYLQHKNGFNYAWIVWNEVSLTHQLVKGGMGTLLFQPNCPMPQ